MAKSKYYVVWAGHDTGIFDNWDDCREQVEHFPGARYKGFPTREAAIEAYRGDHESDLEVIKAIASHSAPIVNYSAIPEIDTTAIAVDAACSRNPGPVEYRGVRVSDGEQLFHVGPLEGGSNNMGEFLALVHGLAMLDKMGRSDVTIYSDSKTAMAWVRNRQARTTITPTKQNEKIRELVARAEAWLRTHSPRNRIVKWNTEEWGEIPADFGRK